MPSLLESRHRLLHFLDISWEKKNQADIFTGGNWIFSQSRTMSSRRSDLMAIVIVKLKHRGSTSIHTARKRCIKKGFQGIHDRFQKDLRFRDSQLKVDRTEAKCIEMDELAQKEFTYRPAPEEYERYKKTWSISLNTSGRNAPMKLRSDFSEALTKMHRLHRESDSHRFLSTSIGNGIRRLLHPAHHGGNEMTTGGAHKFIKVKYLWAREMSGITEQGDLLKRL